MRSSYLNTPPFVNQSGRRQRASLVLLARSRQCRRPGSYCRGGSGLALGPASRGQYFKRLLDRYRVFVQLVAQPDWGVGRIRSTDGPLAKVRFANRGTVVVDTRHTRLNVLRLRPIPATPPPRS